MSTTNKDVVIESAVAETFNEHLVDRLRQVIESDAVFFVPSLSRISRNSAKLFRVTDLLLAHQVPILTANYLLRPNDVWVRRDGLIAPDIDKLYALLDDRRGLAGTHRKLAEAVAESLKQQG